MNRRSERASRVREEAKEANRQAEQERQAQGQTTTDQTETFTTTFTFSDGTSRTQEYQTEKDQQRSEEFFWEGRRRGTW